MAKQSTAKTTVGKDRKAKPDKPHADFPLFPHLSGKWAKVIRGKTFYFGSWSDPEGALEDYLDQKDDLYAGRTPKGRGQALTIKDLCNDFLRHCEGKVEAGEMVARTLQSYTDTTDRIVKVFGKRQIVEALRPSHFAKLRADIAKGRSPVSVANMITRTRAVFNFARKNLLIETETKYGGAFDRPTKRSIRQAKAQSPRKTFDPKDCKTLIDKAHTPELKALVLLGLNCGFGNSDCAKLPLSALDLKRGWIDYARPKTGIPRRCPLWAETIEALKMVLDRRERREEHWQKHNKGEACSLVFLTKYGTTFANDATTVTNEFSKLLKATGLQVKGRGFYGLRHTFRTIADNTRDFPACRLIMGHVDDSMDAVYTESIDDSRLRAVTDFVRDQVFPKKKTKKQKNK